EDLQGSIEMVVFPRTYISTAGVFNKDEMVVVRGRVELRDDRLQLIVDAAETFTPLTAEERERAAVAEASIDERPAFAWSEARDRVWGGASGMVGPTDGRSDVNAGLAAGTPRDAREQRDEVVADETQDLAKDPQYQVLVTVPRDRAGGADGAIDVLKQVYDTLTSFDGNDLFRVYLPNGPETVELEFPNSTTKYCVGLTKKLEEIVGDGRVAVKVTQSP
ncbi:MAG: hypothetical protein ACK2T6_08480, partial [Anaerolineae bacterium]